MQALKIAIICDIKHPENSLQDVSRDSKLLPIELEDAWPDSDGKRFFMFTCGCSYQSGINIHRINLLCPMHKEQNIPMVIWQKRLR